MFDVRERAFPEVTAQAAPAAQDSPRQSTFEFHSEAPHPSTPVHHILPTMDTCALPELFNVERCLRVLSQGGIPSEDGSNDAFEQSATTDTSTQDPAKPLVFSKRSGRRPPPPTLISEDKGNQNVLAPIKDFMYTQPEELHSDGERAKFRKSQREKMVDRNSVEAARRLSPWEAPKPVKKDDEETRAVWANTRYRKVIAIINCFDLNEVLNDGRKGILDAAMHKTAVEMLQLACAQYIVTSSSGDSGSAMHWAIALIQEAWRRHQNTEGWEAKSEVAANNVSFPRFFELWTGVEGEFPGMMGMELDKEESREDPSARLINMGAVGGSGGTQGGRKKRAKQGVRHIRRHLDSYHLGKATKIKATFSFLDLLLRQRGDKGIHTEILMLYKPAVVVRTGLSLAARGRQQAVDRHMESRKRKK